MKKSKSFICLILSAIIVLSLTPFESEAASAKSILNKAYKEMKKSGIISCVSKDSYDVEGIGNYTFEGLYFSDNNISHYIDNEKEQWHIKSHIYKRNSGDLLYTIEKTDVNNKTSSKYYGKKLFQYTIKSLKNPTIKKTTKTSYIISGTSPLKDIKKVEITVNKKDKKVSGILFYNADTQVSDDTGKKYAVTNYTSKLSHICYGSGKLEKFKF